MVRHGPEVEEILDEAREGARDLLVIGAHSTAGLMGLLLDDVALYWPKTRIRSLVRRLGRITHLGCSGGQADPSADGVFRPGQRNEGNYTSSRPVGYPPPEKQFEEKDL
jgi:hypothetical protein